MPGRTENDRAALIRQLIDDPDPPPFNIDDLANESARMMAALNEVQGPSFKRMKQYQIDLSPEERAKVMSAKAVWHFNHGRDGKKQATPAVWKSIVKGIAYFTTNT